MPTHAPTRIDDLAASMLRLRHISQLLTPITNTPARHQPLKYGMEKLIYGYRA